MSDYSELKRLADELMHAVHLSIDDERHLHSPKFGGALDDLVAENESLRADAERYQRIKLDASMGGSLIERLDCNVPVKLWDFAIDRELAK